MLLASAFAALLLSACRTPTTHFIIHTDMGDITIRLFETARPYSLACDSCAIPRILQDGFIQLNHTGAFPASSTGSDLPLSGSFVATPEGVFMVQGRRHTDQSLDKWEQTKFQKLSPQAREQYRKTGGTLPLHGQCTVLGALVSGREVLDRITALPCDEQGKPLRTVWYWTEFKP